MTSSNTAPLVQAISYHAWNKDQTMIALSPNNHEVHIYKTNGQQDNTKWEKKYVLDRHGGPVSGIDWSSETNQIVTCGHDRNAYVWKFDDKKNEWQPTLVILRINRAATSVKWSPAGNKFAVSSGAKCVPVCHFEASNDWWISKMIKKHKSTVLSLAWCVNNKFIVTGSADMKCRVFSAYMEGIDPAEDDGFGEVWSKQHEFGEVLCEFDQAKAWVHSVAWSPQGFRLAFSGHGSTMHFVQILAGSEPIVSTVNLPTLPFIDISFLSDNAVVGAGYDMNPAIFEAGGSEAEPTWGFKEFVDKQGGAKEEKKVGIGATQNIRDMFKASDSKGHAFGAGTAEVEMWTKHKNIILNVQVIPNASGSSTKFTTSGIDGRIIFWDVSSLNIKA